ncbi:MAG: DUF2220 domain-containing protein [Spirochaetaceae bacterium]|jgi:hypothetical protein|nr:DUF2220 domain-containing protein [Spirochaetaceae bacterium]
MNTPPDRNVDASKTSGAAEDSRLTVWERQIIDAFAARYPLSAAAAAKTLRPFRIRANRIFPGFGRASPDDRESFLEAAESLEQRGLLSLVWAPHRIGEDLAALVCGDPEKLFEFAGLSSPKIIARDIRGLARLLAVAAGAYTEAANVLPDRLPAAASEETNLFVFLAEKFTPRDAVLGIDAAAAIDLARLTGFLFERDEEIESGGESKRAGKKAAPGGGLAYAPDSRPGGDAAPADGPPRPWGITTRALSVALYGNSKRLETLISLFQPLLNRARRLGVAVPDFSFLDRSFPETFIAGKIALYFGEDAPAQDSVPAPLVNAAGCILSLPLVTILKLHHIKPLGEKTVLPASMPSVLMIENKETFFALAESLPGYSCFLYTGGHPNRAVRSLVSLLTKSGFAFYHAGDLDPDGILILQELGEMAGREIRPLRMDRAVFDRYRDCGRKLEPSMLKRTALISEKTRSIPGMAELINRIEETGMGIEQEIINYQDEDIDE